MSYLTILVKASVAVAVCTFLGIVGFIELLRATYEEDEEVY